MKKRKIYLINPKNPENFWTMDSSVRAVGVKTLMPNAALATLAALTPDDAGIEYHYCDENVSPIQWEGDYDLAAVTGFVLHSARIREICAAFREKGVPVALGGVYATLYPHDAGRHADHLFIGEAEYTWPRFLSEWAAGKAHAIYKQEEHVDLADSPAPDWSHIRGGDYLYFPVQTSKGCPNKCDFCDAIRLVGRRYRMKTIPQVMTEIGNALRAGAETVFFSEDNFFVNKAFTVELLNEIIRWNRSIRTPLSFSAQVTVRVGEDEEILRLMADAKFSVLFLGVESIRPECLAEVNKGHMAKVDPYRAVMNISKYGILPFVGLIVGFDHDDNDTFDELEQFIEKTNTPFASISILSAPENTVLYNRLRAQDRISGEFDGKWHFSTNIVQKCMPLHDLLHGHRSLFRKIYQPERFERRSLRWLEGIEYLSSHYGKSKMKMSKMMKLFFITWFYLLHEPGQVRNLYFRFLKEAWDINPRHFKKAITIMSQYTHHYDFSMSASWQGIDESAGY